MTARPATSKPEPKPAPEQAERLLRMLVLLQEGYRDLALKVADEGYGLQAGFVGAGVAMIEALIHGMDHVASRLNNRRPKGTEDGIRQSQGGKASTEHQMPLL